MSRAAYTTTVLAVAIATAWAPVPARADSKAAVTLLVRVLAYDTNLTGRVKNDINIGVLYDPNNSESTAAHDRFMEAVKKAPSQVVGKKLSTTSMTVQDGGASTAFGGRSLAAVYVCPGLHASFKDIVAETRKRSILSFSAERAGVVAGVAVGLIRRGDKTVLFISPAAAGAEGAALSPALLSLAELHHGGNGASNDAPVRLRRGMVPPRPVQATMRPPEYPAPLRAARVSGRVILLLEIKRDGTVGEVKPRSGDKRLAELASAAVKKWRWEPAKNGGETIAVWLPHPFDFKLE